VRADRPAAIQHTYVARSVQACSQLEYCPEQVDPLARCVHWSRASAKLGRLVLG